MNPSRKDPASRSRGPTLSFANRPHPLFFVFFLIGASGPLVYAANLSGKGHHIFLAWYVIAEIVVLGLALFFGLRGHRK